MTTIAPGTKKRIASTVRRLERLPVTQWRFAKRDENRQGPLAYECVLVGDIEHDEEGDVTIAGGDSRTVYNPGLKVWGTTTCLIQRVVNSDHLWQIQRAFSATRIRGSSSGTINPGSSGTLTSVVGIDSVYPLSTATVYLPTQFVTVAANKVVWAELRWTGSESRWEIYSADCEVA